MFSDTDMHEGAHTWSVYTVYTCCVIISNHNRTTIKVCVVTFAASLQESRESSIQFTHHIYATVFMLIKR